MERTDSDRLDTVANDHAELLSTIGTELSESSAVGYTGQIEPDAFDRLERALAIGEHALVPSEEWQDTPDETTGRLSTVLFSAHSSAPGDVHWPDLQETWLDGPTPDAQDGSG